MRCKLCWYLSPCNSVRQAHINCCGWVYILCSSQRRRRSHYRKFYTRDCIVHILRCWGPCTSQWSTFRRFWESGTWSREGRYIRKCRLHRHYLWLRIRDSITSRLRRRSNSCNWDHLGRRSCLHWSRIPWNILCISYYRRLRIRDQFRYRSTQRKYCYSLRTHYSISSTPRWSSDFYN